MDRVVPVPTKLNENTFRSLVQAFPIPHRNPIAVESDGDGVPPPVLSMQYRMVVKKRMVDSGFPKCLKVGLVWANAFEPCGLVLCSNGCEKLMR